MTRRSGKRNEYLLRLMDELCDKGLSDEQQQELEALLANDRSAQIDYVRYMDQQAAVRTYSATIRPDGGELATAGGSLSEQTAGADEQPTRDVYQAATTRTNTRPGVRTTLFGLLAGLAACLAVALWLGESSLDDNASSPAKAGAGNSTVPPELMPIMAKLEGAVGARWAGADPLIIEGSYFQQGQQLELLEGVIELLLQGGYRMVVQGPAMIGIGEEGVVDVPRGRFAAYVPPGCPPLNVNSNRAVLVADAGEFGAEIDDKGSVEMRVYYGKVVINIRDAYGPHSSLRLAGSEGVKLDAATGDLFPMLHPNHLHFVRYLTQAETVVSLAQLVSGSDTESKATHSGISLQDGTRVQNYLDTTVDSAGYLATPQLNGIDGVFVPDGTGGPVQVDSVGRLFDGFPVTNGKAWGGAIMARQPSAEQNLPPLRLEFQDGVYGYVNWLHIANKADELCPEGHGLIGIHSNGAITFDLHAIRRQHPNQEVLCFRALVGNLESKPERFEADAWVLIDGEQRFHRNNLSREDGPAIIEIPLTPKDRFLVLAATDCDGDTAFDWITFGDAVIELQPDPKMHEF